jgi:hypothetical protein
MRWWIMKTSGWFALGDSELINIVEIDIFPVLMWPIWYVFIIWGFRGLRSRIGLLPLQHLERGEILPFSKSSESDDDSWSGEGYRFILLLDIEGTKVEGQIFLKNLHLKEASMCLLCTVLNCSQTFLSREIKDLPASMTRTKFLFG